MPQVSVTINGRQFRMACENGEEAHVARLAEDLDQRITRLRTRFGEIGDTRLTVMAALTLADDIDYETLPGLSNEVRHKLKTHKPRTIGHASRIDGITPAALTLLAAHLHRERRKRNRGAA